MKTALTAILLLTATPALAESDEFDGRRAEYVYTAQPDYSVRTAGERRGAMIAQAAGATVCSFLTGGICGLVLLGVSVARVEDEPTVPAQFRNYTP